MGLKVEVAINNDQKQVRFEDCGLFAIANCVHLAVNCSASGNSDQAKMFGEPEFDYVSMHIFLTCISI